MVRCEKDLKRNVLIAVQGADHPLLKSYGLMASQLHWVDRTPVKEAFRCSVKTRYRQTDIPCTVIPVDDNNIKVMFDDPQVAVTPGQSAVFTKAMFVWVAVLLNNALNLLRRFT